MLKAINLSQNEGKNLIIEGVHATPKLFESISYDKIGFFLDVSDEDLIKRYDLKNEKRSKKNFGWYDNFDVIKVISKHLKESSNNKRIIVFENKKIKDSVDFMIDRIKDSGILGRRSVAENEQ